MPFVPHNLFRLISENFRSRRTCVDNLAFWIYEKDGIATVFDQGPIKLRRSRHAFTSIIAESFASEEGWRRPAAITRLPMSRGNPCWSKQRSKRIKHLAEHGRPKF